MEKNTIIREFMSQRILGIDVGSYSIKIAQIERSFGEFKLIDFFELPLVGETVLTDIQSAAATLHQFFLDHTLSFDYSVIAIPGTHVSLRIITLPFSNIRKIDQALEFELESLIPFDLEEILYDYCVISKGDNESKVLVAYQKEDDFKKILSGLHLNELDPRYIGVDTLDLAYLPNLGVLPPEGRYAIIDIGHTKTNLMVLEGSQTKLTRCLAWGGKKITQRIERYKECSFEEAEKIKHEHAVLKEFSQEPISQLLEEEFHQLLLEIKQSLFSLTEKGEPSIQAVYLCGGSSKISGVDSFFSSQLKINVSFLEVLNEQYNSLPESNEGIERVIPSALGIAMQGIYPAKGLNINFRRGDYAYTKHLIELGGSLKKMGAMAAALVLVALTYFIISFSVLSSQVSKFNRHISSQVAGSVQLTNAEKEKINTADSAIKTLNSKINSIQNRLGLLQEDTVMSPLEVLKKVSEVVPSRSELALNVDSISINENRVQIQAQAPTYEDIFKIRSKLEAVQGFKNVEDSDRKQRQGGYAFNLGFDLVEEGEKLTKNEPEKK